MTERFKITGLETVKDNKIIVSSLDIETWFLDEDDNLCFLYKISGPSETAKEYDVFFKNYLGKWDTCGYSGTDEVTEILDAELVVKNHMFTPLPPKEE